MSRIRTSARRRIRALSEVAIVRDAVLVAVAAVIVFVLVLLVRYTDIGKPLFEFGSAAAPRDAASRITYSARMVDVTVASPRLNPRTGFLP